MLRIYTADSLTQTHTGSFFISHPPAPAVAAGVEVAAAPPSAAAAAAEASVAGAGVPKASEVHPKPRRGQNHQQRDRQTQR